MNIKELATAKDFPSHKLEIYKPNNFGKQTFHKILFFTKSEALQIAQNLNSPGQFLVFGSESYPKFGCFLEEMTSVEVKDRNKKYFDSFEKQIEQEELNKKNEQRKKINNWIKENPEKWGKIKKEKKIEISKKEKDKKNSFFWNLSESLLERFFEIEAKVEILKIIKTI